MDTYEAIYQMKPLYEDIKNSGKGWYRLKWKAIKGGTYSIYWTGGKHGDHLTGIRYYGTGAHNGWNRYYDGFHIELGFWFKTLNFWIVYNFCVHKDGPSDVAVKKPLNISHLFRE